MHNLHHVVHRVERRLLSEARLLLSVGSRVLYRRTRLDHGVYNGGERLYSNLFIGRLWHVYGPIERHFNLLNETVL